MADSLDYQANLALFLLQLQKVLDREHMGAIYANPDGTLAQSNTVTSHSDQGVKGTLQVPAGMLRALFHNHPSMGKHDVLGVQFSPDDKAQARRLRKPSYILTPDFRVRKFDPSTNQTTEVLEEFPTEVIRALLMQVQK